MSLGTGGLQWVDLVNFDRSLKITWLRKLLIGGAEWAEFACFHKINRLIWSGGIYHQHIIENTTNPFWKSVVKAYKEWYRSLLQIPYFPTEFQPLWGNPRINIPFNNTLYQKGLIFVNDFMDETGRPLTLAALQAKYECNIMFTVYFAIFNAIPREWKNELLLKQCTLELNLPPPMQKLLQCKKGTSAIRKIWSDEIDENIPIGQFKWVIELVPLNINWQFCYTIASKYKLNARTRFFHYQVLHRTVMTNKKLNQFRLRPNDQCDVCKVTDTISHLLYYCENASNLWRLLFAWLSRNLNSTIQTDIVSTLLGNPANEPIVNVLFMLTKEEIFKSRCRNTIPNFKHLLQIFKEQMLTEIYLGTVKNSLAKVLGKWSHIHNALSTL